MQYPDPVEVSRTVKEVQRFYLAGCGGTQNKHINCNANHFSVSNPVVVISSMVTLASSTGSYILLLELVGDIAPVLSVCHK